MDDALDTPPPSKLKKVLPLVGVLLLGLGGGFGASMMMGGGDEADAGGEQADGAAAEAGDQGKPAATGTATAPAAAPATAPTSAVTSLGRFTVNLHGSGGGRILQMDVALESDPESTAAIEGLTPRLRDSIISAVSDYTWTELEGTDGKTRLKDELLTRINGVTAPVNVHAVYLTSFVVS